MATTRLIPLHINKGKTIAQTLYDRTSYAQNPKKTDQGEWVSSYACNPETADAEFMLSKRQYKHITGREQKSDVIAYQYRQSFKPGEITPEEANRVGYEFAERWLKGNYAFIVATHVDKNHIHNHIVWNSTSLDCTRKFRDFKRSGMAARKLSDLICTEHNLSVIEKPARHGLTYDQWLGNKKKPSQRDRLCMDIDAAMQQMPKDFPELLALLQTMGYEIKLGENPSFKKAGDLQFVRLDSIKKKGYSKQELLDAILGKKPHKPLKAAPVNLIIDIQQKLAAGKGAGYAQWAKVFNLKQMAKTLNYLQEHQLFQYEALAKKVDAAKATQSELLAQIKDAERQLLDNAALQTHLLNYSKTRDTYIAYRKAGYSKKFLQKHKTGIMLHKAAKKAFDDLGLQKLPTRKSLQIEYAAILQEKKKAYVQYSQSKEDLRELLTIKANIDQILGFTQKNEVKEKEHNQR